MLAQDWGRGLMLSEFELGLKVDVLPGLSGEETKLRELIQLQVVPAGLLLSSFYRQQPSSIILDLNFVVLL